MRNILNVTDCLDAEFLVGAYREEKNQLAWIREKKLYNIRKNVNLFESRDGGQLAIHTPNFIILYNYKTPADCVVFECLGYQEKTSQEMKAMDYPNPQGAYFVFEIGKEYTISSLDLKAFLAAYKQTHGGYKDAAPIIVEGEKLKAYVAEEDAWFGIEVVATKVSSKKKKSHKPQESREAVIKRMLSSADIREDDIERLGHGESFDSILELLLRDQTRGGNAHILWATTDYQRRGDGYYPTDEIQPKSITKKNSRVVRPRAVKSKEEQQRRIKQKAEVFTPSWVCNAQNNLIDEAWFGHKDVFNHENEDHTWTTNDEPIRFSEQRGHTWLDYVTERRLELCCGEGPYIVSRYDTTTGELIPLKDRIGLLDRKLRVVGENAQDIEHWREYAYKAVRSVYGFEWQGDNLLLARENVLVSFIEYFYDFCKKKGIKSELSTLSLAHVAYIISWNLWQMDGIRYIIPYSDQEAVVGAPQMEFEEESKREKKPTGIYAKIAYWTGDGRQKYLKQIEFRNLIKSK